MRKVLNVLQSTWLAYKNVTEETVYTCVGHPLKTDIENIVKWLLNENFQTTYKSLQKQMEYFFWCYYDFVLDIQDLKVIKGLALDDILTEVHTYVHRSMFYCFAMLFCSNGFVAVEFPTDIVVKLVDKMAEIEYRLSTGANENIQLTSLISAFQHAKELYPPETV